MTKQTISTTLDDSDWIYALEDKTVGDAIQWLSDYQRDYLLAVEYDWGTKSGGITYERTETDEEEAVREALAAKEKADRAYQLEWTRMRREREAQDLGESQKIEDLALAAYLKKHEGNPNIDDLNNLFRALVRVEQDGHPKNGAAISELKACTERLENV